MRFDGVNHVLGVASLAEDLRTFEGMVRGIGPALIVEIVQQPDDAPFLFVFVQLAGIGPHRRFDGQHVLAQALALRVLTNQRKCVVAVHASGYKSRLPSI